MTYFVIRLKDTERCYTGRRESKYVWTKEGFTKDPYSSFKVWEEQAPKLYRNIGNARNAVTYHAETSWDETAWKRDDVEIYEVLLQCQDTWTATE